MWGQTAWDERKEARSQRLEEPYVVWREPSAERGLWEGRSDFHSLLQELTVPLSLPCLPSKTKMKSGRVGLADESWVPEHFLSEF